MVAELKPEKWR